MRWFAWRGVGGYVIYTKWVVFDLDLGLDTEYRRLDRQLLFDVERRYIEGREKEGSGSFSGT